MPNLIDNASDFLNDLDYSNLGAADQAKVNALCDVATQLIQKYCNRIFLADDYEEYHDGTGHEDAIFIINPPINSLTQITIIASDSEHTETDYDDACFNYDSGSGEIFWDTQPNSTADFLGYFPCGRRNILVSYNGGFSEVPAPIQMVAANLINEMFDPSLATSENMDMEKLGQYQYRLKKDSADRIIHSNKKILDLYKIRRVR
jgi:hypothetical protein